MPKLLDSVSESIQLSADEWRTGLREQLGRQIEASIAARTSEREKSDRVEELLSENRELIEALQVSSNRRQALEQSNRNFTVTIERQQSELAELTASLIRAENDLPKLRDEAEQKDELAAQTDRQANEIAQLTKLLLSAEQRLEAIEQALKDYALSMSMTEPAKTTKPLSGKLKARMLGRSGTDRTPSDIALLKSTPYFNAKWYLENNPDVASAGTDPYQHYLDNGAREGRNPSPLFDSNWYLSAYTDVEEIGINPLVHFLRFGLQEGRLALSPVDNE